MGSEEVKAEERQGRYYGNYSFHAEVYIDCRCNMLFYSDTSLSETAGAESEIYAVMAAGRSRDGVTGRISGAVSVCGSFIRYRRQYERSFHYVHCLYRDDSDGAHVDCFQTGQKSPETGAGNGDYG